MLDGEKKRLEVDHDKLVAIYHLVKSTLLVH